MKIITFKSGVIAMVSMLLFSCNTEPSKKEDHSLQTMKDVTAKEILGNPDYQAISYGGYRKLSRDTQPSVAQLKEDMKILAAMNIKLLRTYNVQLDQASNVLKAIRQLKEENSNFEMYVMLGAWIDCKNAWTDQPPIHDVEEAEANAAEIARTVNLANEYPDIVKIIAVGNEAMVKWAASYFVQADVILKYVNHLQELKAADKLPKDLWITSSDNFASWGGGGEEYHTEDLAKLIKAVDFVSLHTYPMHDTHYNAQFWGNTESETHLSKEDKIGAAMKRALYYAQLQFKNTAAYIKNIDPSKPVHIGETGWATAANGHYGPRGSKATDEFKSALYYELMRDWTNKKGISCFYFEAFNEPWKDARNKGGSENHFGLFDVEGKAKYVLWDLVDQGVFKGLSRDGNPIVKTYDGDKTALMQDVLEPPVKRELVNAY